LRIGPAPLLRTAHPACQATSSLALGCFHSLGLVLAWLGFGPWLWVVYHADGHPAQHAMMWAGTSALLGCAISPISISRPSENRWLCEDPRRTKSDSTPIANPSAHNSFLRSLFHSCRNDQDPRASKREGRRCHHGPLHQRVCPPMGGRAAVEWLHPCAHTWWAVVQGCTAVLPLEQRQQPRA
jgi:hypothetical protein